MALTWIATDPSASAAPPRKKPAATAPATTDASAESDPAKAEAAKGTKAMTAKQYGAAADAFESAFNQTPTYKWLYSAAAAREKNRETAKAANEYARYLKEAPAGAKERPLAQKALAKLSPRLGQLVIEAKDAQTITVDGEMIASSMIGQPVYTMPGSHNVEAKFAEGPANQSATAFAGQKTSLVLVHPDPPPPSQNAAGPDGSSGDVLASSDGDGEKKKTEHRKPLPPVVVYVGAGVTVAAGAVAVISGLGVNSAKSDFDKDPSQANLDKGKSAQTRTNIALAVTGVAAVFTGVTAIFLVDWKGKSKEPTVRAGFGPGSLSLSGTF